MQKDGRQAPKRMDPIQKIDANAVALSMRNFGYMPQEVAVEWMSQLPVIESQHVPLPKKLIIEIANTCNLDCPMCRVGQFGVNLERVLPIEAFEKILTQLPHLEIVRLNGLGESTIVPDFDHYLNLLLQRQVVVELITNGSGRVSHYQQILNNNGVVLVSWDAAEKATFEKIRRPANWELYTEQLVQITQYATTHNATGRLFLIFTLQPGNINQLMPLMEKCREWGIKNILVNVAKLGNEAWLQKHKWDIQKAFRSSSGLAKEYDIALLLPDAIADWRVALQNVLPTSASGCRMPWEEAVIRWNGDVTVCNMFNPYTYGNLYLNDFITIWNNAFAKVFRQFINTKLKHPYCEGCVYINDAYQHRKQ